MCDDFWGTRVLHGNCTGLGTLPSFFSRIQFWSSQICWEQIWLPKDGLDSASLAAAIEGGPQECVRQLAAGLHGGGSIFSPLGMISICYGKGAILRRWSTLACWDMDMVIFHSEVRNCQGAGRKWPTVWSFGTDLRPKLLLPGFDDWDQKSYPYPDPCSIIFVIGIVKETLQLSLTKTWAISSTFGWFRWTWREQHGQRADVSLSTTLRFEHFWFTCISSTRLPLFSFLADQVSLGPLPCHVSCKGSKEGPLSSGSRLERYCTILGDDEDDGCIIIM